MRVLIAHSFYRVAGGEDGYVRHQVRMLAGRADVHLLSRRNATLPSAAGTAVRMTLNPALRRSVRKRMLQFLPDVVHLHNPYPAFGPTIHQAARDARVPLVQTVHNLRLRCPNGLEFTRGEPCQRCAGGSYANAVTNGCFADRGQAVAYATALWYHRFVLRLDDDVARYIAPSAYIRDRLVGWGIPRERVVLVRHATDLPAGRAGGGEGGVFVGRLSPEKGIDDLLAALVMAGDPPFTIVGGGPLQAEVETTAARLGLRRTVFAGWMDRAGVERIVSAARFMVVPSVWEEAAGLVALEAMACGRPVVVTRTGGLPELVAGGAGIAVARRDPPGLAAAMAVYLDDAVRAEADGLRGLHLVATEATPEAHADGLMAAYRAAAGADGTGAAVGAAPRLPAVAETPAARPVTGPGQHQATIGRARIVTGAAHGAVTGSRQLHVLMAHSYYQELGGENLSFEAEVRLLRENGHRVTTLTRDNREIPEAGGLGRARMGVGSVWSFGSAGDVRRAIADLEPDIVHFQNTMPLLSPAAIRAAAGTGTPVVVALRNYRAACVKGTLFRDGAVCEDCLTLTVPVPALVHACYRGSRFGSAAVAAGVTTHRLAGTWQHSVDAYAVPSAFARDKLIEAGFPPKRMHVKPNFVDPDPGVAAGPGRIAIFAGRLSSEKGILTMLEAWRISAPLPLVLIGDGSLRADAEAFVERHGLRDVVTIAGSLPNAAVLAMMADARVVIFPSEWYETFGRVFAEAYAHGVPVAAARIGTAIENLVDGVTGRLYEPRDSAGLAAAVADVIADPVREVSMRRAARATFEERFTAARNIERLLEIYDVAMARRGRVRAGDAREEEAG